jgi:hypothetical protein
MIMNVFASVPVLQLEPAVEWYQHLFGPATSRSTPDLAEWRVPSGGGLRLHQHPDRAGRGSFTVFVSDIEHQAAELDAVGVPEAEQDLDRTSEMETITIRDPDGNSIAFVHQNSEAEPGTQSQAR